MTSSMNMHIASIAGVAAACLVAAIAFFVVGALDDNPPLVTLGIPTLVVGSLLMLLCGAMLTEERLECRPGAALGA